MPINKWQKKSNCKNPYTDLFVRLICLDLRANSLRQQHFVHIVHLYVFLPALSMVLARLLAIEIRVKEKEGCAAVVNSGLACTPDWQYGTGDREQWSGRSRFELDAQVRLSGINLLHSLLWQINPCQKQMLKIKVCLSVLSTKTKSFIWEKQSQQLKLIRQKAKIDLLDGSERLSVALWHWHCHSIDDCRHCCKLLRSGRAKDKMSKGLSLKFECASWKIRHKERDQISES